MFQARERLAIVLCHQTYSLTCLARASCAAYTGDVCRGVERHVVVENEADSQGQCLDVGRTQLVCI
jgi:hypothetical protein